MSARVVEFESKAQRRLARRSLPQLVYDYKVAGEQMRALRGSGDSESYSALAVVRGWIEDECGRRVNGHAYLAVSLGMCPDCMFMLGVAEGFCRECGEDKPSVICSCGSGPFFRVAGARFPGLCGVCSSSASRPVDGWTPENSND